MVLGVINVNKSEMDFQSFLLTISHSEMNLDQDTH